MSKETNMRVSGYNASVYTDECVRKIRFSTEEGIKVQVKAAISPYVDPGRPRSMQVVAMYGNTAEDLYEADVYIDVDFYNEDLETNVRAVIATVRSIICQQR